MPEKSATPTPKEKPQTPLREARGRSGEGARSVVPYLMADRKARAVARIAKRAERDF